MKLDTVMWIAVSGVVGAFTMIAAMHLLIGAMI